MPKLGNTCTYVSQVIRQENVWDHRARDRQRAQLSEIKRWGGTNEKKRGEKGMKRVEAGSGGHREAS